MRTLPRGRSEAGFTLVELMVVVAIISILAALAVVRSDKKPEVFKAGTLLAMRVADASREARTGGPVLDTIVANETIGRYRSQLIVGTDTDGQYISVELRLPDPLNPTTQSENHELSRVYMPRDTVIVGYEAGKAYTDPAAGAISMATLSTPTFALDCTSDGVCGPITFFLQNTDNEDKRRVVVLPLSSMPLVLAAW